MFRNSLMMAAFSVIFCFTTSAKAELANTNKSVQELETQGYATNYVIPIYNQIIATRVPAGFHINYENATETQYIIESVPKGETVTTWSRMLTITGYKDLVNKNTTLLPINLIQGIANGFKKACPASFSAQSIWKGKLNGYDAFSAVVGCGTSPTTRGKTSETALITVIRGEKDYYSIQMAERGSPSATPQAVDMKKWGAVFKNLNPIRVCKKVAGEKPPYPSCIE